MLRIFTKLLSVLDRRDRRRAAGVLCIVLVMALLEAVGIASILPFLAVLANPEVIDTNPYLARVYRITGSDSKPDFLFVLGLAAFALLVGLTALRAVGTWLQLRFTNLQLHIIGVRLLSCYLMQPYHWFLNRHSSDLTVAIIHEVNNVVQNVLLPSMVLIANAMSVTLVLALLLRVDAVLAMSAAAVLGIAYAAVFFVGRRYVAATGEERVKANYSRNRALSEAFGGIKYVKLAGLEPRFAERFSAPSERMARLSAAGAVVAEMPSLVMQGVIFGGMLAVLVYLIGVHGDVGSALPVIGVFAVAGYRLMPALQAIYKSISQIRFALPSLEVLRRDLLALETSLATGRPDEPRAKPLALAQALGLDAVTYRYPNAERASLAEARVTISARTTVGVVGSTGAGKTTFVDIVLGLLTPTSGRLVADGVVVDGRYGAGLAAGRRLRPADYLPAR